MKNTKMLASGAMLTALCIVLMLLGSVLELGMYAAPLLAGLCLVPYGQKYGKKYHFAVYAAVSLLSFFLVPSIEQNLMFFGLLGWYPAIRQKLQFIPVFLRILLKLFLFNLIAISIEMLVMLVLVPETLGSTFLLILLLLGNITFAVYDAAIPVMVKHFKKLEKLL